jgi:hypothetical protein
VFNDPTMQPDRPRPRSVVILGAQRFDSTLGAVVRDLHCDGPIALITTGWREREDEDERLVAHLSCETHNLRLYARTEQVFERDPELGKAHRDKQSNLRHKQDFYRIRLEHELEANRVIRSRHAPADVLEEEEGASLAAIRALDEYHLAQCKRVRSAFETEVGLRERPAIVEQREEIAEILSRCQGIAIAGGHVAALLNRMRLFAIDELIGDQAVFAWSGGGMVISEKVVLFHDFPPQGSGASEVLDEGLGLVPGVVVLPHPYTRLRMDSVPRVSLLARRFAPARCLAFPEGAHVTAIGRELTDASGVSQLHLHGIVTPFEPRLAHDDGEGP